MDSFFVRVFTGVHIVCETLADFHPQIHRLVHKRRANFSGKS